MSTDKPAPREWTLAYSAGLMNQGRPEDILLEGDLPKLASGETVRVIEYAAFQAEQCKVVDAVAAQRFAEKERDGYTALYEKEKLTCDRTIKERDELRETVTKLTSPSLYAVLREENARLKAELAEQRDAALVLVEKWRTEREKLTRAKAALERIAGRLGYAVDDVRIGREGSLEETRKHVAREALEELE